MEMKNVNSFLKIIIINNVTRLTPIKLPSLILKDDDLNKTKRGRHFPPPCWSGKSIKRNLIQQNTHFMQHVITVHQRNSSKSCHETPINHNSVLLCATRHTVHE